MSKREEFKAALKEALKSKDDVATATIRLILAALKDRDIAVRAQGKPDGVEESEILSMLQSMIKQRKESSATYADAGRMDLAEREDAEIAIIKTFLPRQLGESEIENIIIDLVAEIGAADIKDMGKVMGEMKSRYAGQLDMGKVSALVKSKLA